MSLTEHRNPQKNAAFPSSERKKTTGRGGSEGAQAIGSHREGNWRTLSPALADRGGSWSESIVRLVRAEEEFGFLIFLQVETL